MNRICLFHKGGAGLLALMLGCSIASAEKFTIVKSKTADAAQQNAATELSHFLGDAYKSDEFPVKDGAPMFGGDYILLGTLESQPELKKYVSAGEVAEPGSFVVKTVQEGKRTVGIICGNHSRAVLDGVYAQLENLGYGFYLEYNALENLPQGPFNFDKWSLRDAPIVQERFLFNWHNFLSGCTGWNLEHYQKWIRQASRMRYNGIKLHFYGNNPGFEFTYNGETKPVGFLGSSNKGPEWGTQLINDVRRLPGGDIFDHPVFASDAAQVPDDQRVEAAVSLMQQVMEYADSLGMKIHLGIDMDHFSCNPINVIQTLPENVRFKGGKLVRPDTPEGHAYYKSQLEQLLATYPQLDTVIVWSRGNATDWMEIKESDLPAEWKSELDAVRAAHPELNTMHRQYKSDKGAAHLAYAKITTEFLSIVKEIGREDVEIGYGGWWPRTGPQLWLLHDLVENPAISLWVKDYSRNFPQREAQAIYKKISETRKIYPIDWAQHDDGRYCGRPYQPHAHFADLINHTGIQGYGIVHWMTWPLDIHPKNTMRQVWKSTLNESYADTCHLMAKQFFGPAYEQSMGDYLTDWMDNAPQFGRETGAWYLGHQGSGNHMKNADKYLPQTIERINRLKKVDRSKMSVRARSFYDYFLLNEAFIAGICDSSVKLEEAQDLIGAYKIEKAREVMRSCKQVKTVELYSKAAQAVGPSRGEAGHLTNLANTWLPSYDAVCGQIGLQLIGYNCGPVPTDSKALGLDLHKHYIDREGFRWEMLNPYMSVKGRQYGAGRGFVTKEIAGLPEATSTDEEVAASYIEQETPLTLDLKAQSEDLLAGKYSVELYFPASLVSAKGQRVVRVSLAGITKEVDLFAQGSVVKKVSLPNVINTESQLSVLIEGVKGNPVISGVKMMLLESSAQPPLTRKVTATNWSGAQGGNTGAKACDGKSSTRWSVQGYPQSIEFEPKEAGLVDGIELTPYKKRAYQFRLEGRRGPDAPYELVADETANTQGGVRIRKNFPASDFREFRLTVTGCSKDNSGWVSLHEIALQGAGQ